MKDVGEPCSGEPNARLEVAAGGNRCQSAEPRGVRRLPPTLPIPLGLSPMEAPVPEEGAGELD